MANSLLFSFGVWNWFILAILLALLELVMPGYFIIWYGLAAFAVGGLAMAIDMSWQVQLALYAVIGIGLLIVSLRFAGSKAGESDRPLLNKRGQTHIGNVYVLLADTKNGRGHVKVGDGQWRLKLEDGKDLPKGASVLITGVTGTRLIGRAATDKEP